MHKTLCPANLRLSYIALGPGDGLSFATFQGGDAPRNHEIIEQVRQPRGMSQLHTQEWEVSASAQTPVGNTFYGENVDGGLYWLWDMTWNGETL